MMSSLNRLCVIGLMTAVLVTCTSHDTCLRIMVSSKETSSPAFCMVCRADSPPRLMVLMAFLRGGGREGGGGRGGEGRERGGEGRERGEEGRERGEEVLITKGGEEVLISKGGEEVLITKEGRRY